MNFRNIGPLIFQISQDRQHEFSFEKGKHDQLVERFQELSYGNIVSPHNLLYARFFDKRDGKKHDQKLILGIKKNKIVNLNYSKLVTNPSQKDVIRNNAIMKNLTNEILHRKLVITNCIDTTKKQRESKFRKRLDQAYQLRIGQEEIWSIQQD